MRTKITMEMSICQAENGFSLDELVKRFADAFENKTAPGMLKINLQLPQKLFEESAMLPSRLTIINAFTRSGTITFFRCRMYRSHHRSAADGAEVFEERSCSGRICP